VSEHERSHSSSVLRPPSPDPREAAVREAFRIQGEYCDGLGSPFTAELCRTIGVCLNRSTSLGERILGWRRRADAAGDSVPLRLAGGLHALARSGRAPRLAAIYPPHHLPARDVLWDVLDETFRREQAELARWLDMPRQTNEVGRSAPLMAGLLVIAAAFDLPMALYEIGASAGLNLILDRYSYRLGAVAAGAPASPLLLSPQWTGASPPRAEISVNYRRGVDLRPLRVSDPADCERLVAYVWPDQRDRVERTLLAIDIARAGPPPIGEGDAADWVEQTLPAHPQPGVVRVLMHTIAFQYFPKTAQERVIRHIGRIGTLATPKAPFAWLRFEVEPQQSAVLRLTIWPGGTDRMPARGDAHGRSITWLGAGPTLLRGSSRMPD
jgi:hypothetical protein